MTLAKKGFPKIVFICVINLGKIHLIRKSKYKAI